MQVSFGFFDKKKIDFFIGCVFSKNIVNGISHEFLSAFTAYYRNIRPLNNATSGQAISQHPATQ